MAQSGSDKRATRRFSLQLPVAVKHPQDRETCTHTRDVNSRGVCFYADAPLVVGSSVQLTLTLPAEITLSDAVRVRCVARVVRVQADPKGAGLMVAAVIDHYDFLGGSQY